MPCYLTCAIAVALITASFFTCFAAKKYCYQHALMRTLTPDQRTVYIEIVDRRFKLYVQGMILGLLLGALYLMSVQNKKPKNKSSVVCTFVAIVAATQYFYYSLMPKKKWMLDYVTSEASVEAWLDMYKYMKNQYHWGFVIGLAGYAVLCMAFVKDE